MQQSTLFVMESLRHFGFACVQTAKSAIPDINLTPITSLHLSASHCLLTQPFRFIVPQRWELSTQPVMFIETDIHDQEVSLYIGMHEGMGDI